MIKSYKSNIFFQGLKFSCAKTLRQNKWKAILSALLIFTAICTGIIIAVRMNNTCNLGNLQEISLSNFYEGLAASSSAFFSRSLSLVLNLVLLCLISLSPYLFPLALVLFVYRGYLFGLNFALIFIFYGFGSMLTAIIIILPCQLFMLALLLAFYFLFSGANKNCKKYGSPDCNRVLLFFLFTLLLLLVNLLETFLLFILNGKVIFVI